jgi:TonB family protein
MNAPDRLAGRLIDSLVERVSVPPPPSDLISRSRRRPVKRRLLAVALLAAGTVGGALVIESMGWRAPERVALRGALAQVDREAASRVIVDHLRVHRRLVEPRIAEVPRADAVIVSAGAGLAAMWKARLEIFPGAWADEEEPVNHESLYASAMPSYHLRILRARMNSDPAGSALIGSHEFVIPLTERERWGRADQTAALRDALGAAEIESLPGLVVLSGSERDGAPHRFETAMGEDIVALALVAEPIGGGWHRVRLTAAGPGLPDGDLLDTELRVADGATVAVAAPLYDGGDTLVISVTPLGVTQHQDFGKVAMIDGTSVTPPSLVEKYSPVYPRKARDERLTGKVIMEIVVRKDGTPDRLVVIGMPERGEWLAGAAAEAVSKWRWEPAKRDGVPVDVYMTLVVDFQLK